MTRRHLLAALAVAIAAFALYRATLLPGFDFGDTGSFQTQVGSSLITPRDGYPLYFALGGLFLHVTNGGPAHALNLLSAVEAALACGLLVLVAVELSDSIGAAVAAACFFAVSYTFWSQAIIAEVYALHMVFVGLTLLLLLRWSRHPTDGRLTLFLAAYALGFGNHLSMILLAPGYTIFILMSAPRGWRSMFAPRIVALAAACAIAGALPYLWNLRTLWLLPDPPHGLLDGLQTFWFDVTKSDWRDTMVASVPRSLLRNHLALYGFDLDQQFGMLGPTLAVAGLVRLSLVDARRAVLMVTLYTANVLFAFSYNVGDTHVFYLPSHLILAMLVASGVSFARVAAPAAEAAAVALLLLRVGIRGYDDFPALDRSGDTRPAQIIAALTADLDSRRAVLLTDMNWQVQNGLAYFAKVVRDVAYQPMPDVILEAPAVVARNRAMGRTVALTERAAAELRAAYGPLLPVRPDPRVDIRSLSAIARDLPVGTRYVLCVLRPLRGLTLDTTDVAGLLRTVSDGTPIALPTGDYAAVAGRTGEPPRLVTASDAPFRTRVSLGGVTVDIRMDSWLAADTIRRMGFGHVIANRRHTLIVERGVSFVAFDEEGRPISTAYASNIFAPQPRFLVETR